MKMMVELLNWGNKNKETSKHKVMFSSPMAGKRNDGTSSLK